MNKRFVMFLSFILTIAASFILGYMVSPNNPFIPEDISDELFIEVLDELMENHYKQPSRELLIEGAINGMIGILDDPFTSYFDFEEAQSYTSGFGESYVGIGVIVQFLENRIVVQSVIDDGPADNAGIRPNDIIAFVDGIDIASFPFYQSVGMIIGDVDTTVVIGVIRTGVEDVIYFEMVRETISNPTVESTSYQRGTKIVGYIQVNTFGAETDDKFHEAIMELELLGIDSLIIDLRVNGGGYLFAVTNMLNEFLLDNGIPMFSTESYSNGQLTTQNYYSNNDVRKPYNIVTLVNENSASASEVFASAMQEHGGYPVIGVTTYGKGTMQTDKTISLIAGDVLHITIGKWFTSDGNWVHYDGGTDGVIPDLIIETNDYENAYKIYLINDEDIMFDTVDFRTANIQLVLNIMGYTVRTDGYFDLATKTAILDIQLSNSLTNSGNIDSETLEIINQALSDYQSDPLNDTQLEASINYLLNYPLND